MKYPMRVCNGMAVSLLIMAGLTGCAAGSAQKTLTIGTTYTAAVSMAMLKFKVLAYTGQGWYRVQLIGSNMEPFTTKRPALINSHQLSLLQRYQGKS